jgi:hypothetical protein
MTTVDPNIEDQRTLDAIRAIRDSAHEAIGKLIALEPVKRQQLAGPRIPQPNAAKRRRQAARAARRANR